jgi:hypothetical protein
MSYIYLQEQGAESSAECFSEIPRSVLSRLNLTAEKCSCNGSGTESCRSFRSGTMCGHSTASHGADSSISSAAGSPVRTSQQPEKVLESTEADPGSGPKWRESLAKYDRVSRSWRIRQCSFLAGLDEFSETWPRWGMTRDGASYRLPTPVLRTCERGSGFWPTPCRADGMGGPGNSGRDGGMNLRTAVASIPTPKSRGWKGQTQRGIYGPMDSVANLDRGDGKPIGGSLNPDWVEWLMGWPIGQTALKPLETGKFRQWWHSHGGF